MIAPSKNIQAIVQISQAVMCEGQYADKAFESYFRENKPLSNADTGFIVQEVYSLIRNWRLISEIQARNGLGTTENIEILIAIGQVLFNKNPTEFKTINQIKRVDIHKAYAEIKGNRAILHSIPDWLDKMGNTELAERWPTIIQALNQEAQLVIRTNTIKCNRDKLQKSLQNQGLKTSIHDKAIDALIFSNKLNVFKLPEFKQGLFEMQDVSSQLVGHFANPQPGMRVIDGCAGNGGKTLHLASLMQNKGRIIALDLFPGKLGHCRPAALLIR